MSPFKDHSIFVFPLVVNTKSKGYALYLNHDKSVALSLSVFTTISTCSNVAELLVFDGPCITSGIYLHFAKTVKF